MAFVWNNGSYSALFKTTIGVKQGGPLSPRLFSVYVEDLIVELEESGLGTSINGVYTGVIMYADDLVIMSDDKNKLQKMLLIIEKYCKKWEIKINASKSQYIKFGPNNLGEQRYKPTLEKLQIERVDRLKYLGVWIQNNLKSEGQISEKSVSSINAFNALRKVGIAEPEVRAYMKSFLYKVYCRPILYYGVENLALGKGDIKKIQTAEAKLVKYSLNLSKTVHSSKLLTAMDIEPAADRIKEIKLKFFLRILRNEKTNSVMNELIKEFNTNRDKKIIKNSLLKDIAEYTDGAVCIDEERIEAIKFQLKLLKEKSKEELKCEEVKAIKTCLESGKQADNHKLKQLVQSFVPRPSRPARARINNAI
jgi:hypothetical protein